MLAYINYNLYFIISVSNKMNQLKTMRQQREASDEPTDLSPKSAAPVSLASNKNKLLQV